MTLKLITLWKMRDMHNHSTEINHENYTVEKLKEKPTREESMYVIL